MLAADGVGLYIVDDDPSVRTSLTRALRAEGAHPQAFATAEEFLEFLPAITGPSCALLDIGLPGKSGLELHARLQALWPEIAVVFLTGHGDVPGAGHHDPFEPPSPARRGAGGGAQPPSASLRAPSHATNSSAGIGLPSR